MKLLDSLSEKFIIIIYPIPLYRLILHGRKLRHPQRQPIPHKYKRHRPRQRRNTTQNGHRRPNTQIMEQGIRRQWKRSSQNTPQKRTPPRRDSRILIIRIHQKINTLLKNNHKSGTEDPRRNSRHHPRVIRLSRPPEPEQTTCGEKAPDSYRRQSRLRHRLALRFFDFSDILTLLR